MIESVVKQPFDYISGPASTEWRQCAICDGWVAKRRRSPWVHSDGDVYADAPTRHAAAPGVEA